MGWTGPVAVRLAGDSGAWTEGKLGKLGEGTTWAWTGIDTGAGCNGAGGAEGAGADDGAPLN
jgi:hypothetical protein